MAKKIFIQKLQKDIEVTKRTTEIDLSRDLENFIAVRTQKKQTLEVEKKQCKQNIDNNIKLEEDLRLLIKDQLASQIADLKYEL